MHRPKIYLDTTIPSYIFNEHVPDKQKASQKLFTSIKRGDFETFISDVVLREIYETKDKTLKEGLIQQIKDLIILEVSPECERLALEYIRREIIPVEFKNDALHIACSSVYEIDFLISYNYEHIVRIKTIDKVTGINLLLGFKTPRIVTPEEVLDV